ncbi:MAG TPA: hypothetical protein VGR38_06165 [Candidatus Polarisedimenticolia bacterium]|nr:hypothetical protein [Candidatus Polarisedimenticolia bacterium]
MKKARVLIPILALEILTPGCAHALKEPPPLQSLGPPLEGGSATKDVDSLLRQADSLYATRALPEARKSVALFLQAARADASRVEGLLGAARVLVWLVGHEPDAASRDKAATDAVHATQWCQRIDPASSECDYWLGAAVGVQARERHSTALDALPLIEAAFRRAAEKNPSLEEGGPHRALALLYARAPGWPMGPGDPYRALEEARKAVELSPQYPPNQLALGEALRLTGSPGEAREAYSRALELARTRLSEGDRDASEWVREAQKALAERP